MRITGRTCSSGCARSSVCGQARACRRAPASASRSPRSAINPGYRSSSAPTSPATTPRRAAAINGACSTKTPTVNVKVGRDRRLALYLEDALATSAFVLHAERIAAAAQPQYSARTMRCCCARRPAPISRPTSSILRRLPRSTLRSRIAWIAGTCDNAFAGLHAISASIPTSAAGSSTSRRPRSPIRSSRSTSSPRRANCRRPRRTSGFEIEEQALASASCRSMTSCASSRRSASSSRSTALAAASPPLRI